MNPVEALGDEALESDSAHLEELRLTLIADGDPVTLGLVVDYLRTFGRCWVPHLLRADAARLRHFVLGHAEAEAFTCESRIAERMAADRHVNDFNMSQRFLHILSENRDAHRKPEVP